MQKTKLISELTSLLERASRIIHLLSFAETLYPAQWTALRYFSQVEPYFRTTASLARFQGMSLGPVSRTVRTLVDKGFLTRVSNPVSRKADLLELTDSGRDMMQYDPRSIIIRSISKLDLDQLILANKVIANIAGELLINQNHNLVENDLDNSDPENEEEVSASMRR